MFFNSLVVATILGILCISKFKSGETALFQMSASTVLIILCVALVGGLLGEYAYFQAIASTEHTGRAVAITSAYPLITILISMLFLGEKLTLTSGIGTFMIICGITLLSTSGSAS